MAVPADVARKIDTIALARHVSRDRAMTDLLLDAITTYEQRRDSFLGLAARFQNSTGPAETEHLRGELARMNLRRLMARMKWRHLPLAHGREIE